jgi:outer membrane protein
MKMKWILGLFLLMMFCGGPVFAQEPQGPLTLEESIKIALERSLTIHSATEGVEASKFKQKQALTNFLPQWTGSYYYTRYNRSTTIGYTTVYGSNSTVLNKSRNNFNLNSTVSQPLFTGGATLANYRLEKLGVDDSKASLEMAKKDVVLSVREGYFSILKTQKTQEVAEQVVKQLEAHVKVAQAYFDVGITPKNDLLQSEVKLAQAKQDLIKAENGVALAKASFNNLLRKDINAPLNVVNVLEYKPFPLRFEDSLEEALRQREEIKSAELKVEKAKQNVKIARSDFFPTITLSGNYNRFSDEIKLGGAYPYDRWTIQTSATFTLGDWGKTAYKVGESKIGVTQAEDSKNVVKEGIILEVKEDYLDMVQAEKNIGVSEKTIEQAEENLRMNEERYKYQVATSTDVLDAVILLAQSRVNYYNALSDFNTAKAKLERAMGRMYP